MQPPPVTTAPVNSRGGTVTTTRHMLLQVLLLFGCVSSGSRAAMILEQVSCVPTFPTPRRTCCSLSYCPPDGTTYRTRATRHAHTPTDSSRLKPPTARQRSPCRWILRSAVLLTVPSSSGLPDNRERRNTNIESNSNASRYRLHRHRDSVE